MYLGHIDAVTIGGNIYGWACAAQPTPQPVTVTVYTMEGVEVAWGLAHLFREDLVAAKVGYGWCAFQLRAKTSAWKFGCRDLILAERTRGVVIAKLKDVPFRPDEDTTVTDIATLSMTDPTMLSGLHQLEGCDDLFRRYILKFGIEPFICAAYVYVLGRAVDESGLATYGRLLRRRKMLPMELLRALFESEEFTSRSRFLVAPNMPGFPFAEV
jgi:hypothetical protein